MIPHFLLKGGILPGGAEAEAELPSHVETQSNHGFTTTNVVPALTEAESGDLLIAFATQSNAANEGATPGLTPPSEDWTLLGGQTSGDHWFQVYYMTADGPLAQTSWVWEANHWATVAITCYRSSGTPTDLTFSEVTTANGASPAQTPGEGERVLIAGHSAASGAGSYGAVGTLLTEHKESNEAFELRDMDDDGSSQTWTGTGTGSKITVSVILPPEA